jgi:hypothetical protein
LLDAERAQVESSKEDCRERLREHSARMKQTLRLNKMLMVVLFSWMVAP